MKKAIIILICLIIGAHSFAENGINFSHGAWKEILAKAKQDNKLVFIDVYTSWCGPCKMMAATVFPQKQVGELFNHSFVNYQVDAEKGEGIDIAKQFNVHAFPTYLFVNGDGNLIYRTTGYMPSRDFLEQADIALKEKEDPKPFSRWQEEYEAGNRDKQFLIDYLQKRALLKLPSANIMEELFPLLSKEELAGKSILSTLLHNDLSFQCVPQGKVFNYVMQHYQLLDSLKLVPHSLYIVQTGIMNYFDKNIIAGGKAQMLPVMINANRQVLEALGEPQDKIVAAEKDLPVKYYTGTRNEEKLETAAIDYVQNGLMKMDNAGMQADDAAAFEKFIEPYRTGKKDSTKEDHFDMARNFFQHRRIMSFSYQLRDAAESVYKVSKDKRMLMRAAGWAKKANEYYPHFSNEAVYAGLLFNAGHRQQAIKMMLTASEDPILKNSQSISDLIKGNLEKMKKGIAPENLWHLP